MIKKIDLAVQAFENGNRKEALRIAKEFRIGVTSQDRKDMAMAYECMVHQRFYKMLGKDLELEIANGLAAFHQKILCPYKERGVAANA